MTVMLEDAATELVGAPPRFTFEDVLWIRERLDAYHTKGTSIYTRFTRCVAAGVLDIKYNDGFIVCVWEPHEEKPFGVTTIHTNNEDESECLFTTASHERYSDRATTLVRIIELIQTQGVTTFQKPQP